MTDLETEIKKAIKPLIKDSADPLAVYNSLQTVFYEVYYEKQVEADTARMEKIMAEIKEREKCHQSQRTRRH